MGIHGLSFFIKSFPTLVEKQEWEIRETKPETYSDHFIIDGNAFVYHVAFENRTNWTHGGQYAAIADAVTSIVDTCHRSGIELTFLFDGALPQDKIETRLKRHRSYIERCATTIHNLRQINASNKNDLDGIQYYGDIFVIPPLTLEVVIQTLKELNVTVKICQAEADGEVVALANEKKAYVVSQDSDMHVYPHVGKGYISLEQWKVPLEKEAKFVSASVFHPESLAKLLVLEPHHLPLLGTLLGNDYLEADIIRQPISQWCTIEGVQIGKSNQHGWPKIVAELIRKNNVEGDEKLIENIVSQLNPIITKSNMRTKEEIAATLEDRIHTSISRYDMSSPLLKTNLTREDSIDTTADQLKYYTGEFSRQVLDIVKSKTFWTSIFLEDIERECSWNVSRPLREALYGVILLDEENQLVDEYIREKQHLEAIQVQSKADVKKTQHYFYSCHSCTYPELSKINKILHPTILCLRYMIYHCSKLIEPQGRLCNHEVIAMIIAGLKSLAPTLGFGDSPSLHKIGIPALKKRSLHIAAQYQSTIYSSYLFSQILDIPNYLQSPRVLSHMYHGIYFHYYLELARGGSSIGRMLHDASADFKSLFSSVYKVVTHDLDHDIEQVFDYGTTDISDHKPKRVISQKSSSRPEKKKKSSSTTMNRSNNAFNVLSFGCNFDD